MAIVFDSFESWKEECNNKQISLFQAVIDFEVSQKGNSEDRIWQGLSEAYDVMKNANVENDFNRFEAHLNKQFVRPNYLKEVI